MEHIIVPPGQEAEVIKTLVGPTYELEPVCPLCGHQGASRVWFQEDTPPGEPHEEVASVGCYLNWCAAHGVHAPIRRNERMPYSFNSEPEGVREAKNIRCDGCGYFTQPSAFCRPTGPAYKP